MSWCCLQCVATAKIRARHPEGAHGECSWVPETSGVLVGIGGPSAEPTQEQTPHYYVSRKQNAFIRNVPK